MNHLDETEIKAHIIWILFLILILYLTKKYFNGASYTGVRQDLSNKYAVVTGGCSGIGRATVISLAKQGCHIIVGDIISDQNQSLQKQIQKINKSISFQYIHLDLGNLKSIKNFVNSIVATHIDYLINNAGVMGIQKREMTDSGFQKHCGINYIGHFYLTHLLWSKLHQSKNFRIVNISSITHKKVLGFFNKPFIDLNDLNFQKTKYSPHLAYSRSKFYCILFTKALAQKLKTSASGKVVAVHPGIARSNVLQYLLPGWKIMLIKIINPIYAIFTKSCERASQTTIAVINMSRQQLINGQFYADCCISKISTQITPQKWQQLWKITQQQLCIKFGSIQ